MFILLSGSLFSQETDYGSGFQTLIIKNPGFTGSSPDGIMRLSYFNFYPGNHYNLHSVFLSYDSYFPAIHGGAGFYISEDYLGGIVNELRGGLSYSYFLQAGRDLFINAGLSAAFFHRGFNFSNAVFPDQIDPMGNVSLPTSEILGNENKTVFDIGTGFMFIYRKVSGGFAITHLTQPDLSRNMSEEDKLKIKYCLHIMTTIDLERKGDLKLIPLSSFQLQGRLFTASAGAAFESRFLTFNSLITFNNNRYADLQTGFSVRWEKLAFFYNYRFNLLSGNSLIPFSIVHQTGLTLSLYNVEKRIKAGTINVPVM